MEKLALVRRARTIRQRVLGSENVKSDSRLATMLLIGLAATLASCSTSVTTNVETPMPVASVEVSPAVATLMVGGSLQLIGTVLDADGGILPDMTTAWTSGDTAIARVDASGLVTGLAEGTVTITATSDGHSGSVAMTVLADPPPPAGIIIFEDDFESQSLGQWDQVETTGGKFSITTDPANVQAGSAALQILLNSTTRTAGQLSRWFMPGYEEVWLVMDVKVDGTLPVSGHFAGLQGHRIDDKWSAYGKAGVRPNGQDYFQSMMDPAGQWGTAGTWSFYSYWPDMGCGGSPCWGNYIHQDVPQTGIDGTWQRIVRRMRVNTVGQTDGLQELWINGELKIQHTGLRWRDTEQLLINDLAFFAYFANLPGTNHIYIDNVQVRTDPPPGYDD